MRTLKLGLERPNFIWFLIVIAYGAAFWFTGAKDHPPAEAEQAIHSVIGQFAASSFPPKIQLVREVPDWGHLGYYALMGRVDAAFSGAIMPLRAVHLGLVLLVLFVFIRLGHIFTYKNRLNPLWISLALVLLAANPYLWWVATTLDYIGLLLLLLLLAMYFFEKDLLAISALFTSLGVLVDWRALLLAVAFVVTRMTGEHSRLLRPERLLSFLLPFVIAAMPLLVWQGVVPQGQAREWWVILRERIPLVRPDGLFYSLALLPVYGLFYTWAWGLRARTRALIVGAIWTGLLVPFYFVFPIQPDHWLAALSGLSEPLGLLDRGAMLAVGEYKNLLLFVPWLAGTFLLIQLLLLDVLDRSRWMRYFIVLYFAVQPFLLSSGDRAFLIVLPVIFLFTLCEALVGEEGKLG